MKRHRLKNPITGGHSDKTDLVMFGFLAVGVYLIYQILKPTISGISSGVNSVTSGIASLFPGTSPTVQVQGTVALLNGQTVPVSSLQSNGFNADGSLNMVDGSGNSYNIVSSGNGNYSQQ